MGNVETIRESIEAWNRDGIEGVRPYVHPEGVVKPFEEWPDDGVYHGLEGLKKLASQWSEQFDDLQWEINRVEAVRQDVVLALFRHNGTVPGTEVPVSAPIGALYSEFTEDGRVGRLEFFLGWDKAVEAAEQARRE